MAAPLRVREQVLGVLAVTATEAGRFDRGDVDLLTAVASHVALAIDRAASFQTIEDLSRSLEDKVRVRTEQLRAANEELRTAYRDLQTTQLQLIQREKMASVGQLVAGVAHELNNPIGFISSNVATLADFVQRLRAMLATYQEAALPEADRARVDARRREPPGRLRAPVPRLDDLRHPRGRRPDPQDRRRPAGLHPDPRRRVAGGRPARGARFEPDPAATTC